MIVVVGGGITGLMTGWELEGLGADYVVLESADRAGGVIRSGEIEGRVLDWGPQRARMTASLARLVDALDLADDVVTAPDDLDLFVFRDGALRRVPFGLADLAGSDVVSLRAKLRLLVEPLTPGPDPDESVSAFFRRKLGSEIYETLVGPLYGGLYASDPADMRVGVALGPLLTRLGIERSLVVALLRRGLRFSPPPACSFRDGMQALPDALARALGERLRLGATVRRLRRAGSGWQLELSDGVPVIDAHRVVLTTPASTTAALLERVAPAAATSISRLHYNPLAIVHLVAHTELRGLGFQVAFTEPGLLTRGVTFNDSLFARQDLYTAFLGGARHPEVTDMRPGDLASTAEREFLRTTGSEARALSVERASMPAWDTTWRGLSPLSLPPGLHIAGNWWSRPGLPGRFVEARAVAAATAKPTNERAASMASASRAWTATPKTREAGARG